jgi:hypothetical protein
MNAKRWQKLTGFVVCAAVVGYALHVAPSAASVIIVGGLVPVFGIFVTGNVKEGRTRADLAFDLAHPSPATPAPKESP